MAFSLSGKPVVFDLPEFEALVTKAGGFTFRWKTSSMGPLRELAQKKADGLQMRQEFERIGSVKAAKYDKALRYLIFHYPGVIPSGEIVKVDNPIRGGIHDTFGNWVAQQTVLRKRIARDAGRTAPPHDVGDLVYGCTAGRDLPAYQTPNRLTCDKFNMAAEIATKTPEGKGAFGRYWGGRGNLEATPTSVLRDVKLAAATQTAVSKKAMEAYTETVLGSRYSPETVFDGPTDKLQKDTQVSLAGMKQVKKNTQTTLEKMPASARPELVKELIDPAGGPEDHMWMHARFVKAVRRACKGGIAMAATHPLFKEHKSKVFFILDQLGDLGTVAIKKALPEKGDYVAITSSELSFVFRYWNHDEVPLKGLLKFFVNGRQVLAPWEGDWRMKDAKKVDVYSNQEAWKRYALYRSVTKPAGKPFPKSGQKDDEADA